MRLFDIQTAEKYRKSLDQMPLQLKKIKIPFAQKYFYQGRDGYLLLQSLPDPAYPLHYYYFMMERACTLTVHTFESEKFAFLYIKEGQPEFKHISWERMVLEKDNYYLYCIPTDNNILLYLKPGTYRLLQLDIKKQDLLKVQLRAEQEENIAKYTANPKAGGFCLFQHVISPYLKYAIRQLSEQEPPDNKLEEKFHIIEQYSRLIRIFVADFLLQSGPKTNNRQLLNAMRFIEANIDDTNVVEMAAKAVYVSPATLYRIFHKHCGKSPNAYRLEYRMRQAELFIRNTFLSLKEIAYRLGYKQYSNFYAQFNTYFNDTPQSFLKKYRMNENDMF